MNHHEEDNALIEGDAPAAAMHAMIDANNHNQYFDFDATMMSVDDTLTMESGGHLMNHTNNHHANSQAGDVENSPPMTRQRKVSFGAAHPSQQQHASTRQRRVDDGESSASDDQFQENPPVTAIAMPIDVTYYYDEESATTRDTEEGATSKMEGISFSSATGTMDTGLNHRKFMASIPESQHPTNNSKPAVGNTVDAVPSEFEIKIQHNQGDSSSRIRQRVVQQGSAAGDALTNGAIADTASMTPSGGGGSSSRSLSKLGKFHSRFTDRGKATSPRSSSPKTNKAVLHTKIAFITLLLFVASISSYILFTWLTATETTFARDQFTSIAERAVVDSANTVARKRLSMATMSTVISEQFRNQSDWPEVSVVGYDRIVNMLAQSGAHVSLFVCTSCVYVNLVCQMDAMTIPLTLLSSPSILSLYHRLTWDLPPSSRYPNNPPSKTLHTSTLIPEKIILTTLPSIPPTGEAYGVSKNKMEPKHVSMMQMKQPKHVKS